jgi:hypothetical protein
MRSKILLSQTAYEQLLAGGYIFKRREPLWLRFKGFGFAYPIYELHFEDIDQDRVVKTIAAIKRGPRSINYCKSDKF